MSPFTYEQYQQLLKNGSRSNRDQDHFPVAKLILPHTNCCWLLSEIDPDESNIAFGLADLGHGFPEMGYISLSEIFNLRTSLNLVAMVCPGFKGEYPLSVYARAARIKMKITSDKKLLQQVSDHFENERQKRFEF